MKQLFDWFHYHRTWYKRKYYIRDSWDSPFFMIQIFTENFHEDFVTQMAKKSKKSKKGASGSAKKKTALSLPQEQVSSLMTFLNSEGKRQSLIFYKNWYIQQLRMTLKKPNPFNHKYNYALEKIFLNFKGRSFITWKKLKYFSTVLYVVNGY